MDEDGRQGRAETRTDGREVDGRRERKAAAAGGRQGQDHPAGAGATLTAHDPQHQDDPGLEGPLPMTKNRRY